MQSRIPPAVRDDAMKAEIMRLFDETKHEMRIFEKLFILATKQ